MNEEKIYTFNEYILGYDKGNNDRSCLIISKIINGYMYVMSSLYDGSADVISMILDNLQKENKQLKERLQQKEDIINKANKYVINHLKQDMLSDFTGANYIQEYIEEPDGLLEILDNKGE